MGDNSTPEAAVERAILIIRRRQSKRRLARMARNGEIPSGAMVSPAILSVLDIVEELVDAGRAATTTAVADQLETDQPRASRLVAKAVARGLLTREFDPRDGRRSLLVLTPEGQTYMRRVHQFRRNVFARVLDEWPEEKRHLFASLLTEFVEIADRQRGR